MSHTSWLTSFLAPPAPTNLLPTELLSTQFDRIHGTWRPLVDEWYSDGPGAELVEELFRRRFLNRLEVMPKEPLRAFNLTPMPEVRIVILGEEPSSIGNVADGLAFSSHIEHQYCSTTRGIIDELDRDLGFRDWGLTSLEHWARRGVLLLNMVLTVEHKTPRAHIGQGWEGLTDYVLQALAADPVPKVFMLWGKAPQTKAPMIQRAGNSHLVLESRAPALSYKVSTGGHLGCGHFSQAKQFLGAHGFEVDWTRGGVRNSVCEAVC